MKNVVHNAEYTKKYNRNSVLRLLIKRPVSRIDLAKITGLTPQTISNIVDCLCEEGMIVQRESSITKKGRTPIILELSDNVPLAVGVYLSREECRVGLVDLKGKCLVYEGIACDAKMPAEKIIEWIKSTIHRLMDREEHPERILGIGISSPGPLDKQTGVILNPPDLYNLHNVDIVSPLVNEFNLLTLIESTACSLATYEKTYGNAKDISNFLLLLVDSGIGCGIISSDKLFRGTHLLSGEIGHITIDINGEKCSCGNIGCLDRYASIPNTLALNGYAADQWPEIVRKVRLGDKNALAIVRQQAKYLVSGLVNAINLFDPEAIILAGDIIDVFGVIQPYMHKRINERSITRMFGNIDVLSSSRNANSNVISAANIIFEDYLTNIN